MAKQSQSGYSYDWILVKKRIDRTQARLDKVSNQDLLLEAAHSLRIERERQKELETQLENQKQDIQRASTVDWEKCGPTNFLIHHLVISGEPEISEWP